MSATENNQRKSSGRGGKRAGAGRKPGSANQKTREIADRAAKEGITPLEVMLFTMHAMMAEANAIINKQKEDGQEVSYPLGLLQDAAAVAKDAAPYMHPRLAAIEHSGPNGGPIEVMAKEQRDAAVNAALRADS